MRSQLYKFVGVFGMIVVATLGVAQAGSAARQPLTARKTVKFTSTCNGKLAGSNVSKGTCHSTLGPYSFVATLAPPNETETDTHKNGKIYVHGTVKLTNSGGHVHANGTWKITGGTGAYKHASGGGNQSTALIGTDTVTKLTGKITY